jgi:hypothetical protein
MLIHVELGNPDLALTRLRFIERRVLELFPAVPADGETPATPAGGPYQPVLVYLACVHDYINDPAVAQHPQFVHRAMNIPAFMAQDQEDLQVLSFYAWLKAKVVDRPYYEVLLQLAND